MHFCAAQFSHSQHAKPDAFRSRTQFVSNFSYAQLNATCGQIGKFARDFNRRRIQHQIAQTDAHDFARAPSAHRGFFVAKRENIIARIGSRLFRAFGLRQCASIRRQIEQLRRGNQTVGKALRAAQNRVNRACQSRRIGQRTQQTQAIARRFAQVLEVHQGAFRIGGVRYFAQRIRHRSANLA